MESIFNETALKRYYYRYIKENGIYERCKKLPFDRYNIFDSSVRWGSSDEGYFFWKYIQINFIYNLILMYDKFIVINLPFHKTDLIDYFHSLKNGYSGTDWLRKPFDAEYSLKVENLIKTANVY